MNRDKMIHLTIATLEPSTARVLIKLPGGRIAMIRGITSANGEIIILTTLDARLEMK